MNRYCRALAVLLVTLTSWCATGTSSAQPTLVLNGYQRADGAITVKHGGDVVDPYFATLALLIAHRAGMNIDDAAQRWISWALTQQQADGRFARYCTEPGGYTACAIADADDAMLAVWVELILTMAPSSQMPTEWHRSWQRAYDYLSSLLLDRHQQVYIVSRELRVALLMDNLEVYSALTSLVDYLRRTGDNARAAVIDERRQRLHEGILDTFWRPKQQRFRASTQAADAEQHFYPDLAAQLFPLLLGYATPGRTNQAVYDAWVRDNLGVWLAQGPVDYPWGLLAIVSEQQGDTHAVQCWLANSVSLRHGTHWNVLEEAAYQILTAQQPERALIAPSGPCPTN